MKSSLANDARAVIGNDVSLCSSLAKSRILLTGGTGFVGKWLLELLIWAIDELGLDTSVTVVTRNPKAFQTTMPELANHSHVSLRAGDVATLEPLDQPFSHVIHSATTASVKMNVVEPALMFDTILQGTRRVLGVARRAGVTRFLFVSSGAVYGRQPSEILHVPEDHSGAPDPLRPESAYGEGKRAAELLCAITARETGMEVVSARGFAFAGPYLPLDSRFAIGNFVRDALSGGPIRVAGDGTPVRSYLYGADMAMWLWTILAKGRSGQAYNVGSEHAISIVDLAVLVDRVLGNGGRIETAQTTEPGSPVDRYVPSTARARGELGLEETVDLDTSVRRMAEFAEGQRCSC